MKIALVGRHQAKNEPFTPEVTTAIYKVIEMVGASEHSLAIERGINRQLFGDSDHSFDHDKKITIEDATECDVMIVIGGDGTALGAARTLQGNGAILAVNGGHLGFISSTTLAELEATIALLLKGKEHLQEQKRSSLVMHVNTGSPNYALNDIVIERNTGRLIEFEVTIDDEYAYTARADGLIIATPTGSTAYAMAAGGPIISLNSPVIELIPMMPQTLSCRPLIIGDKSTVKVKVTQGEFRVNVDGRTMLGVPDSTITIVGGKPSTFLTPKRDGYFEMLRTKLNWQIIHGRRPKDNPFNM